MVKNDTICAISTAVGNGGVAVIRVSGEQAKEISGQVFEKLSGEVKPRMAIFGELKFDGVVDQALALYFPAPRSFTGEEVVELQIHGGYYLAQNLVQHLISLGARMAEPGEFSRRAVMNGKIDISEAEGIIDLINANSKTQLRSASSLYSGSMSRYVAELQQELTDTICEVNVALDYPEHDIEYITAQKVAQNCKKILEKIENKLKTASTGLRVANGVNVALAGLPNAGKSSLLNALLGYERAIVTDIAGTTRDTVKESYEFNGVLFNITDTAGLRDTQDIVESAGIARAKDEISHADIVVVVCDSAEESVPEVEAENKIVVASKIDRRMRVFFDYDLGVSAKTGENVEALKQLIFDKTINNNILVGGDFLTNSRHITHLKTAKQELLNTIEACGLGVTLDCLAVNLMEAWNALGQITGETASDTIISEIFSRFCLGK